MCLLTGYPANRTLSEHNRLRPSEVSVCASTRRSWTRTSRGTIGLKRGSSGHRKSSNVLLATAVGRASCEAVGHRPANASPPEIVTPSNGSDNQAVNITALMSATKLVEPQKKRGWLRSLHRH